MFQLRLKQSGAGSESKKAMACDQEIQSLLASARHAEAFEMMLGVYRNKVFRLAYSMLGDRELAEDAAQEVFLRIWKALARYRRESALGTWIYAIARNACLTQIARRKTHPTLPLEEAGPRSSGPVERPSVDILRLVAQLPEKQRQVVMLYHMEDKSYDEVARLLDMPMGTVKTYLHRARKQLATMMKEADDAVRRV
jgi:RNA polymerase sigma-70 factor (ECF subfamily)